MASPVLAKNKIANVQFVTTEIAKTQMRSCSVMDVIWRYIRSATASHIYPKVNGCVGSANCLANTGLHAFSALTWKGPSSKRTTLSGLICCVRPGFPKSTLGTLHLWSPLWMWKRYLITGGVSCATSATSVWELVFNAATNGAIKPFTPRVRGGEAFN